MFINHTGFPIYTPENLKVMKLKLDYRQYCRKTTIHCFSLTCINVYFDSFQRKLVSFTCEMSGKRNFDKCAMKSIRNWTLGCSWASVSFGLKPALVDNHSVLFALVVDPDDPYKLTEDTRQLGLVVCRGTSVVLICPADGMEAIANPFVTQDSWFFFWLFIVILLCSDWTSAADCFNWRLWYIIWILFTCTHCFNHHFSGEPLVSPEVAGHWKCATYLDLLRPVEWMNEWMNEFYQCALSQPVSSNMNQTTEKNFKKSKPYKVIHFCENIGKTLPSVLWRCWLGGRKGFRPVKTE